MKIPHEEYSLKKLINNGIFKKIRQMLVFEIFFILLSNFILKKYAIKKIFFPEKIYFYLYNTMYSDRVDSSLSTHSQFLSKF
jgi:hypothetical protein